MPAEPRSDEPSPPEPEGTAVAAGAPTVAPINAAAPMAATADHPRRPLPVRTRVIGFISHSPGRFPAGTPRAVHSGT